MPTSTTLLVAYPKELIRAGLRAMLEKTGIKLVGEAQDAASTLTLAKKHKPSVVLLDAAIPGGDAFELVKKLAKALPGTKSVLLSAMDNPTYMARAKAAGASNFLPESVTGEDLVTAIENAAAGNQPTGTGAFAGISELMGRRAPSRKAKANLTPREEQALRHIALGLSNDEIARSMEISVETTKEHVQNLLRKLAVNDRTQAAVWAVRSGLV
jgi:DNA-binding NarL/FixJ family response regulator